MLILLYIYNIILPIKKINGCRAICSSSRHMTKICYIGVWDLITVCRDQVGLELIFNHILCTWRYIPCKIFDYAYDWL